MHSAPKQGKLVVCLFFMFFSFFFWVHTDEWFHQEKRKQNQTKFALAAGPTSAWHPVPSSWLFFLDLHFLLSAFSPWLCLCPFPFSSPSLLVFWLSWFYSVHPGAQSSPEGPIHNSKLLGRSESYQTHRLRRENNQYTWSGAPTISISRKVKI